jgi:hypothetical protein
VHGQRQPFGLEAFKIGNRGSGGQLADTMLAAGLP